MAAKPIGMFCPMSKACDVLGARWTFQILGELWEGSSRFNELRRGLPGISPTLLTKRLAEMQQNGLVDRIEDPATGKIAYIRTEKAAELDPILQAMAQWAQRHIAADIALADRDADSLMWTLHRRIDERELPARRVVMRFRFSDATPPEHVFFLIAKPGDQVQLCVNEPGFDVDIYIETEVPVLTGIYLGRRKLEREIDEGRIFLSGDPVLIRTMNRWLKRSMHASIEGLQTAYSPENDERPQSLPAE